MLETTFEAVRRIALATSEIDLNLDSITPDSTLGELKLIVYFLGPIPFILRLEDEFRRGLSSFRFPFENLGDERFDDQITLQQIVDIIEAELERMAVVTQR